jgi:acyl-CoA synthetase (NDP forming)
VDALFQAAGVIRVDTMEEMLDVAQLLAHQVAPAGPRLALIGNSGGPLILAADTAESAGLQVPTLSEELRSRILERVPHAAATSNPVDLLATVRPADVADVIGIVAASGEVDAIVVASVGVREHEDTRLDDALHQQITEHGEPASSGPVTGVPVAISVAGIPARLSKRAVFRYSESAVHAMSHAYGWSRWRKQQADRVEHAPGGEIDWLAVRRLVRAEATADEGPDDWLAPGAAIRILRAAGIALAESETVATPDAAAGLADRLCADGGRVVMKAVVPGLLHKTEAGAVRLDISGGEAARAVFAEFSSRFANLTGVLVQSQVAPGPELLVGARQDRSAGPLVVVAAGGIEAELLADRVVRAAPLSVDEAREMVLSLHTAPRLTGFRGRPGVDVDAVARAVSHVSQLVAVVPELVEFEVNPFVASASGAVAVDVRMRADLGANSVVPLRGN